MDKNIKKEILFYYESRQNPNGDPGFENQPRQMPNGTIIVTDVRIKRTIRDYAKNTLKETIFVDYDEKGNAVTADDRARGIIGDLKGKDVISELLQKTFDTPLFGALVTIRKKSGKNDDDSQVADSAKLTGPVQFGIGRSTNKVHIINPTITGRFVGKKKEEGEKQFSTFGKFYSVEYALIKIHGAVNPVNLDKYYDNSKIKTKFEESEKRLFECMWDGTNNLITRSKFPQRSVLYVEVVYDNTIFNDLPHLVDEKSEMKDSKTTTLVKSPFDFTRLVSTLSERKSKIKQVRIKGCDELADDVKSLVSTLKSKQINAEEIKC